MWRQRARCKWLKEGDANTAFFHKSASIRLKSNRIHYLKMDRVELQGPQIQEHAYRHFKQLLGCKHPFKLQMKEGAWEATPNLVELEEEFQEDEIKKAVWDLGPIRHQVLIDSLYSSIGVSGRRSRNI